MNQARSIRIRGVVQGVGFRPHVFRLAQANALAGWVLNEPDGVEIHLEGAEGSLQAFLAALQSQPPPASSISTLDVRTVEETGCRGFTILDSRRSRNPCAAISPDLPVCPDCLQELFDRSDRRFGYPYINCTNCGPRYTVIESLPYDRPRTTMGAWSMDDFCGAQYHDPTNRRFHAQPLACPTCGPHYFLKPEGAAGPVEGDALAIGRAAGLLRAGRIVAIKGLGGYHLACNALEPEAVARLRERKFRKEKPFALLGRDLEVVKRFVELSPAAESLVASPPRPIVLAPARVELPGVAPDNRDLGVMLPYTPLHHLLFEAGAPDLLVMTSANRSSEPIAYTDDDALDRLSGLADAFLIGERPIARRVDDSVARVTAFGPALLRRARGYAPAAAAQLPICQPILALGADLKNTVTLVVEGQAFVSQHIGDLKHNPCFEAFRQTVADLVSMYDVAPSDLLIVHDLHPQYLSTSYALSLPATELRAVQHHRAHVASVLAERQAWSERVAGVSFDGTGFGDDGSIWGGEIFVGSVEKGFQREAHLRSALLAGGDAAARHPVQAAAGFLWQLNKTPDFCEAPFDFPARFRKTGELLNAKMRTFTTTSMGRLFDTAAALLGFTRETTYEGQAAIWLQHRAGIRAAARYPLPFDGTELDFRPLLEAVIIDRLDGRPPSEISRAFHGGVARGLSDALDRLCSAHDLKTVVLSGGVFQNGLLLEELKRMLEERSLAVWINHRVPPNDGGISLGQAALAAFGNFDTSPAQAYPEAG